MRTTLRLACLAALGLAMGCNMESTTATKPVTPDPTTTTTPDTRPSTSMATGDHGNAVPDNTAVNERDRSDSAKTPIDQNENQTDINITADIRKRVLSKDGMSINARNSKIITADGKVTLRGPVASEAEKEAIDKIARDVAGKENVDNQLEIKVD